MLSWKLALRILPLFLCGSLRLVCWAQQPSVDEILKKVSETYRGLQSYQFVAEKVSELASGPSFSSEISVSVSNPGRIRLEVTDEDGTLLVVSDGRTKWTYLPRREQYTEEAGTGDEVVSAGGRKSVLPLYRSLFERFRNLSDDSSTAALEREDGLKIGTNIVACYVVKIARQDGSVDELWSDEDRYIVWKSRHVSPSAGAGTLPTITVTVSEAKLNTELGKSTFHFDPPYNAKRVRSFAD